jgi:exodeoxyribonuclease VII small subunit
MAKKKEITSEELSYELAFHELQNIIASIENDGVGIDELALKVKRAGELVQFCRVKLRAAEKEINFLVEQMSNEGVK